MPFSSRYSTKALGALVPAVIALAGLSACLGQSKAPELVSGSDTQVVIVADLDNSPNPLAKSHCGQFGKRPMLNNTQSAAGNHMRGWATGSKVFVYTFDCR